MKNFDLRKYLAEGRLLNEVEDLELKSLAKKLIPVIKKYKMPVEYITSDVEFNAKPKEGGGAVPAKLLIKDGVLTVAVYFLSLADSLNELDMGSGPSEEQYKNAKTQAAKMYKDIVAVIGDEFELRSQPEENKYGYYLMQVRKKGQTNEGKLNEENYTPGSGWTKDFDYDGMLNLALTLDASSPMDLLLKVSDDLEDVNYHRENSYLTDAIDAIKDGDRAEAKIAINKFRKEINKTLNEDTIKERKTISKNKTTMKKSELKEMIKMALSEDARTDAEQEGYKDGFDDAKDDIEAKLKDMKVSEGDNYYEDSMDEAEEVDVEDNEKVDVDIEKDVEVDDKSVETDIEVKGSMPGEDADEIAVQSLLMKAQEEAEKLGDEKLTDQIGNTITYFTRAHVATVDEAEEMDEIAALPGSTGVEDVNVDDPAEDAMVGLTERLRWQRIAGIAEDNGLYSK